MTKTFPSICILAVTVAALASPAQAHDRGQRTDAQCRQDQRTGAVVGGLLGATALGSAGRSLAASGVRPEGAVLGAVVGAVVGAPLGRAAVYCPPAETYTQTQGRSYGQAAVSAAQPAWQPPQHVYQQPYYQEQRWQPAPPTPTYQAPAYQPPAPQPQAYQPPTQVYQQQYYQEQPPQHQPAQTWQAQPQATSSWYTPSSASYYGQERGGTMAPVAPSAPAPAYVPQAGYAPVQPGTCCQSWDQSWTQGSSQTWSYGPTYVPAPQGYPHSR